MSGPKKNGRDFYAILEVDRSANQDQIKQAYRKKAIKFHPDKNPGDETAAEKFKELSTAYAVLSDPNSKRLYDLHGEDGNTTDFATVNVEGLGTMGRLFGALISKAGIPVPTEITPRVLLAAQHLGKGTTSTLPVNEIPPVVDLQFGDTVNGYVERQNAHFYRITVSEEDLRNGVIVSCTSHNGDKLKVVFFDGNGNVSMVEESQQKKKLSEANVFFVPFSRYNLAETMPMSLLKRLEDDVPPVFMILDTFDKDVKSLLPGTHLFCVYGDNWFRSAKYSLRCVVASSPRSEDVAKIQDAEKKLAEMKNHLDCFQSQFCEAKKKYQEACAKLEDDIKTIDDLVKSRDDAYAGYMNSSNEKYRYAATQAISMKSHSGGFFGKIFG